MVVSYDYLSHESQLFTEYIYVIYRAGSPYEKKTVPEVLSTARGRT